MARKDGPVLRVIGRSEFLLAPIREQARKDLDFEISFELIDGIEGLQRAVTRPDLFDVYHQWHTIDLVWTARTIQAIDLRRIRHGGEIRTKALVGRGDTRVISTIFDKLFIHADGSLGPTPSDYVTMLPSIHGVDAFGYVPAVREAMGEEALESWGWMLDPRWRGKVGIISDPVLGMIEAAFAAEAAEGAEFGSIGNLSVEEIDLVSDLLLHKKKLGHFRGIWRSSEEAARLVQKGGAMLLSIFSPAAAALRRSGRKVSVSVPIEGCRGWHADLCISANTEGETLDAAYDYMNWWMSGWAGATLARQGYYSTLPERVRPYLSQEEWDYWYGGRPAATELADPEGYPIVQPGEQREGGSHLERMSRVRVWNTFMDEHTYLVRRWNEFLAA